MAAPVGGRRHGQRLGRPRARALFEHILVAVDFSPAWTRLETQLERLRALGCRRLTLVHVLVEAYTQAPELAHVAHYQQRLEALAAHLREQDFEADTAVRTGAVAVELEQRAAERGAGVILAGSHGHSTLGDLLLGRTVLDLARHAGRPLLLAPTDEHNVLDTDPIGRPLLAADGSSAARPAEALFLRLIPACQPGVLVSVGRWNDAPGREGERRTIEAHVQDLVREAGEGAIETVLPGQGKPSVEIARLVEERGADLVVIGQRGGNPVTDLLLGSTAAAVCRHSRRLTLLVPRGAVEPV